MDILVIRTMQTEIKFVSNLTEIVWKLYQINSKVRRPSKNSQVENSVPTAEVRSYNSTDRIHDAIYFEVWF